MRFPIVSVRFATPGPSVSEYELRPQVDVSGWLSLLLAVFVGELMLLVAVGIAVPVKVWETDPAPTCVKEAVCVAVGFVVPVEVWETDRVRLWVAVVVPEVVGVVQLEAVRFVDV